MVVERISLEHPGGSMLYSCANCNTVLINKSSMISMVCLPCFILFMQFVFLRESFALKVGHCLVGSTSLQVTLSK